MALSLWGGHHGYVIVEKARGEDIPDVGVCAIGVCGNDCQEVLQSREDELQDVYRDGDARHQLQLLR